jgi:hypothetical protein
MKKHYREENDCLNCGATLQGKYCHVCGQENLQIKENFGHMMNHAISDYFHFDHQFFHTLKPLLFKPGLLTNEYTGGRRAQYLHPIKMYIFISILYFLLFFKTGHDVVNINETTNNPAATEKSIDSAKKAIAANAFIPPSAKKEIQKNLEASKPGKQPKRATYKRDIKDDRGPNKWFKPNTDDTTYQQYLLNQKKLAEDDKDSFLERQWNKKVFDYRSKYGSQAREMFTEDIQHNTPKMMFLLLPLFALILRVAFWKNRKFYVEHLIYSLHFHCFLFLFLTVLITLQWIIPGSWKITDWVIFAGTLYIIWYIFRSLRVVYHRSIFRTITKMIGMSFMYFLAFAFCISAVFIVSTII